MTCEEDVAKIFELNWPLQEHEKQLVQFLCAEGWTVSHIADDIHAQRRVITLCRKLKEAGIHLSSEELKRACKTVRGGAAVKRVFDSLQKEARAKAAKQAPKK